MEFLRLEVEDEENFLLFPLPCFGQMGKMKTKNSFPTYIILFRGGLK